MHPLLGELIKDLTFSGDLSEDVAAFLIYYGHPDTAAHCRQVAAKAQQLAQQFGADVHAAERAGWLHDVSAVFPVAGRVETARAFGLEVLPEEEAVPLIIHQKLSVVLAREIFGVKDQAVLSAVGCHTTLKAGASLLDKVVFLADKLAWGQKEEPPFTAQVTAALKTSLDAAALAYQQYLLDSGKIKIAHPWMLASYDELSKAVKKP